MGKCFLLLLSLSLVWSFLQAELLNTQMSPGLKCHKCNYVNSKGECKTVASVCNAKSGQRCILRTFYKGGKFLYGYQGCGRLCFSTEVLKLKMKLSCCKGQDFCNTFHGISYSS